MLKKAPRASFLQSLFERDTKLIRHRSLWDRRGRSLGFSKELAKAGDKPRCFFLAGTRVARALEALADELLTQDCKVDFNIVKDDTSDLITRYHTDAVLSYEENLAKALNADVLIDINQPGQAGLTLRPLEAAFFNKKLITDNRLVKKLEFYHPDRFYILGEERRALSSSWLHQRPRSSRQPCISTALKD